MAGQGYGPSYIIRGLSRLKVLRVDIHVCMGGVYVRHSWKTDAKLSIGASQNMSEG